MTAIHVAYQDGAHRCYVTETGRDRRYIGCGHLSPRSAIEHSDRLQASQEPLGATETAPTTPRAVDPHSLARAGGTGRRSAGSPDLSLGSPTPATRPHKPVSAANPAALTPRGGGDSLGLLP